MSTRSQVTIVMEGCDWSDKATLYHHCDGYPEHIIPCIAKARELIGDDYNSGRTGKVAAFLCAAHPGGFEPEGSNELHPDIEYHYTLHLVNTQGGCLREKPTWYIEIRQPRQAFSAAPTIERMKLTTKRTLFEAVAKKYARKEVR